MIEDIEQLIEEYKTTVGILEKFPPKPNLFRKGEIVMLKLIIADLERLVRENK